MRMNVAILQEKSSIFFFGLRGEQKGRAEV